MKVHKRYETRNNRYLGSFRSLALMSYDSSMKPLFLVSSHPSSVLNITACDQAREGNLEQILVPASNILLTEVFPLSRIRRNLGVVL